MASTMPAKKGSKSGEAYVEVGKEGTLDSLMAGKKAAAAGKRDAEDKAAKEPAKKAKKAKEPAPKKEAAPDEDVEMKDAVVGSGRQAAQNVSYKAKAVKLESKDDLVEVKELARCETEAQALGETAPPPGAASAGPLRARRLGDFSLCSEAGDAERIDSVLVSKAPIYISGVVYPKEGEASKATGRRAEKFGPLVSFSIDYSGKAAQVVLTTEAATYTLLKPAAAYKKTFAHLAEQADIAYEVHHALSPQLGGSAFATLEEVVARLARSKACKSYGSAREGLLVNGRFVLHQFEVLDAASGGKALKYLDTDFGQALQKEVKSYKYVGSQRQAENGGGIHIARDAPAAAKPSAKDPKGKGKAAVDAEPTDEEKQLDADEQYARQLQAQMDAQERQRARAGPQPKNKGTAYIKVSEEEIADDYPFPQAYKKEEEETDELLLADEEMADVDPEYLPRRLLTDFAVYNAEGMFASLELLPMWSGVAPDVELYASGRVVDDDGDFSGGQSLEEEPAGGSSSGAGGSSSGAGGSSSGAGGSSSAAAAEPAGMRMYLSQIREWVVEFGADMLFISLRTDVAWYRLSVPSEKYAPWFAVVLKTARLAAKVLTMLASESRASKVSFGDVVKRIAALPEGDACFISKKVERVERFVVAHGQIILNQFANYPVESVKRSGFAAVLKERMQQLRHCKLYKVARKAEPVRLRGVNRNPMSNQLHDVARARPMTATATTMVKSIWQAYFRPAAEKEAEGAEEGEKAKEVEEDENEEENEDDVQEDALAAGAKAGAKGKGRAGAKPAKPAARKLSWVGASTRTEDGDKFYAKAKLGDVEIALGDAVLLAADEDENEEEGSAAPPLALVQALWQGADGSKEVQVRLLARGEETVLGDAASDSEVFLTTALETHALGSVMGKAAVARLARTWDHRLRVEQFTQDQELRQRNEEAAKEGRPLELFWRRQYVPQQGMFRDAPKDLQLGTRLPEGDGKPAKGVKALADGKGFVKDGTEYREGDFLFVGPEVFDQLDAAQDKRERPEYLANSKFNKGSYEGLRAWGIAQLVRLGAAEEKKGKGKKDAKTRGGEAKVGALTLRRYYRPEDIDRDKAYEAPSFYSVYASEEEVTVDVSDVVGPVRVVPQGYPTNITTFEVVGSFDHKKGKIGAAPEVPIPADLADFAPGRPTKADKGKGKAVKEETEEKKFDGDDGTALATMDIFAGCGGLSEGMHQAGAAYTKWAIEYERPAAEAFRLNNPDAATFCNNCNVLLHAAMVKAGLGEDCLASKEAEEETARLPEEQREALPAPGEVDFICGGPPCQGYSGMNRFNKGNWSMVQNSMVMAFLSYADFYRPRYFLLENVRNFVSHNKSFTFRLTLRSLLDMGYQVRFGVLNAGNFGVAQSRKRTFIWAAAPGELLPDWPRLMHCFRTPQLTINLPGNVQYTAVPQTVGAPLRPVTVRDAIGDLPAIESGEMRAEQEYDKPPASSFQKFIRGDNTVLYDHISKQMNELNLERCRCIPKDVPGADWRELEEIVKADPGREKFKGQPLVPWCLPNTADRHNGWRGLFGRLDWHGHFPTSTTDPQPMGKVGQVFHCDQDRIVSVRECARAQGFPDRHRFAGNIHNKHRQVGNAVPPPLAAALGRELRRALEVTAQKRQQEAAMRE